MKSRLPLLLLLLCACSTALTRPKTITLCGKGPCETVSDQASRERLLSAIHELFRSAKGRDARLFSADPRTRAEKKPGISFFLQGGPIPGRSTIPSLGVADVMFIDRERSEAKMVIKTRATYVGIPVFCAQTNATLRVDAEQALLESAPFCSWMGIGNGVFRLQWSVDFVDTAKGVAGGYWSMRGKGVPLVGGGSGYMIVRFKDEPKPEPAPRAAPAPAPVAVSRPVVPPPPTPAPAPEPVVETVEVVSRAARLTMTTKLTDGNSDLILQSGEQVSLKVEVRNEGDALAAGIEAVLSGEPALVSCLGESRRLAGLPPGDSATLEFSCRLPETVPSDTVDLRVELYSGTRRVKAAGKLMKVGMSPGVATVEEVVSEIGVDDIPPRSKLAGTANAALVVGLGRYREKAIPGVKYAARDAEVVARYLQNLGGVTAENIKILTDDTATKSDLEAYIEDWLPRRVTPESTVFIYYSGHGAPETTGKDAFLVPFEGHPDFPSKLYPLSRLYAALAKLPAKAIVVMLDSCFSGAEGRGVRQLGARPLVTAPEASGLDPRIVVLAGATGTQITSDYDKGEHGLFTYYLLRGMRGDADANRDGAVTLGELYPFVKRSVIDKASRELNRDQTPSLLGGAGPNASLPLVRR